ncbi:MAG: alpha-E domain-containing protein [Pseudomonadota bacterium]|nr:alpha-E domain-containing protein [Pseudomonadota bacterium]
MLLSRVAENLYWMARYIERAEGLARLINVNTNLLLDLPKGLAPGWRPLVEITGSEALYLERHEEFDEQRVLRFLVVNQSNPGSLQSTVQAARENARTIRDIIPREAWQQINSLYYFTRDEQQAALSKRGRFQYLAEVINRAQTLTGTLAGTMNHDAGYTFVKMGRNLERADVTSRFIDVRSAALIEEELQQANSFDAIQWMSVLKSLSGYQMYRQSMQARIRRSAVQRFLLQSTEFPRAVAHCIGEVQASLRSLPRNRKPLLLINETQRNLQGADPAAMGQAELHQFIDQLQFALAQINNAIADRYFPKPAPPNN